MKIAISLFVSLILAVLFSGLAKGYLDTHGSLAFILDTTQAAAGFATAALGVLLMALLSRPAAGNAPAAPARRDTPKAAAKPAAKPRTAAATGAGRTQGTVKWFNPNKGFGFITCDNGDEVFVHYRNIQGDGRRVLRQDQKVSFVITQGEKGPQADDVSPEE